MPRPRSGEPRSPRAPRWALRRRFRRTLATTSRAIRAAQQPAAMAKEQLWSLGYALRLRRKPRVSDTSANAKRGRSIFIVDDNIAGAQGLAGSERRNPLPHFTGTGTPFFDDCCI